MFLRNPTSLNVSVARGHVSDELAVAAVVVSHALRVDGERLVPLREPTPPRDTDPPDISRLPLWDGVSVSAAGPAFGPGRAPHVRPVLFRIGTVERRLIVFGDRRWERRLGGPLVASAPAPFERIDLSFERAFGGGYDLPPGLLPGTDLPHPGLRVAYPLNPRGVGYYADEKSALGALLPSVERPDQLVRAWNDTPDPAGFSPCPELGALRMTPEVHAAAKLAGGAADTSSVSTAATYALRLYHHAPPLLIFGDLLPGTLVELAGAGTGPVRFVVPMSPAKISVRARKQDTEIQPRLRSLHVDAERRVVRIIHAHSFHYDPRLAPSWIRVAVASGGAS
jgi:hypothetical protein